MKTKKMKLDKKALMNLIPDDEKIKFDKYVSPFINFLNSVAGSKTGPNHIGQLSELFQEFISECNQNNIKPSKQEWKKWYLNNQNVMKHSTKLPKSGRAAFKSTILEIWKNLIFFKNILSKQINKKVVTKWVEDLMFTKTWQGFFLEYPIVSFVCKQICKDNDDINNFDRTKLRKSCIKEEAKGIDYVYEDIGLIMNFQIKTGNDNENFRNKSNFISKLPDDVYCCIYIKNKQKINLKVFLNKNEIYSW